MNRLLDYAIKILEAKPMIKFIACIITGLYFAILAQQNPPILIGDIKFIPAIPDDINKLWGLNVFCVIIFTITFISTLYNFFSHKFNKTQISLDPIKIYETFESEGIADDIDTIYNWYRIHNNPIEEYRGQLQSPKDKRTKEFNNTHSARRRLSKTYRQLWKCNKDNPKAIKELVTPDRIKILLDVIEPLEREIGEDYDKTMFNFFRRLYKKSNHNI